MGRAFRLLAAAVLALCLLGGCAPKEKPAPQPAPEEIIDGEVFPLEAQEAVPTVLRISQALTATDPPDLSRQVEYFGLEGEGGVSYYTFTVYGEKERLENLGMYRKAVGEEAYFFYDEAAGGYRRVLLEGDDVRLEE